MDGKVMKNHNKIQKNVSKINKLQQKFGGYSPDLINMYFAAKLECLTLVLIVLTAVLSVLTIVQIILLIRT
jgi:predicted membrane-bound spermidine synthase